MIRRGCYNEAVFRMSKPIKPIRPKKHKPTLSIVLELDRPMTKKRLREVVTFAVNQMAEFGAVAHPVIPRGIGEDLATIQAVRVRSVDMD